MQANSEKKKEGAIYAIFNKIQIVQVVFQIWAELVNKQKKMVWIEWNIFINKKVEVMNVK